MYYNMRIKTIQRNSSALTKILKLAFSFKVSFCEQKKTKLQLKLHEAKREINERNFYEENAGVQFDPVVFYGDEKAPKNPLNQIGKEALLEKLQVKITLYKGRLLRVQDELNLTAEMHKTLKE